MRGRRRPFLRFLFTKATRDGGQRISDVTKKRRGDVGTEEERRGGAMGRKGEGDMGKTNRQEGEVPGGRGVGEKRAREE